MCNAQVKKGCTKASSLYGIVVCAMSHISGWLLSHNLMIKWAFHVAPAYIKACFQALFFCSFFWKLQPLTEPANIRSVQGVLMTRTNVACRTDAVVHHFDSCILTWKILKTTNWVWKNVKPHCRDLQVARANIKALHQLPYYQFQGINTPWFLLCDSMQKWNHSTCTLYVRWSGLRQLSEQSVCCCAPSIN